MNTEDQDNNLKKEKDEVQVTISNECERKLRELVSKISNGFDMARVTRKHVLAHVISQAHSMFSEDDIQAVRKSTITEMSLLDREIREIRRTGVIPEALREYLWKTSNLTQSPKKSKKSRQTEYSNAISENEEAA